MASLLSTYTVKELQKKLKTQKILFVVQTIVVLLMVVLAIFSSIDEGVSFQTFLPLFFAPMSVIMFFEIKKIKKELALRK
ncbi:hypothetical protein H9I45_12260 [Polaribacter haliotis]|uniref:Redox-active disulfide protein 2 n=2 Tax=Polaribacter TaxID=52959 RepID=A0A7L8AE32_9FLAO|nr:MULTISPECIES: hypothetical protein [Polaribacter]QNM85398.1 hypothetical protein H9W90_14610 [Polaribacter pectinis]QOD60109.1 hypothetical protein H9I45_12260 [Polaribacter haliotis]